MRRILYISLIGLILFACKKDEDNSGKNPFNDPSLQPPEDTSTVFELDSSSFQFLYYNVFKPTCSNSGCHDGNFQPDFRTIYSSYNTLVNHAVLQNDDQQSFTYRVVPYNVEKSLLNERLTVFMPNTSGIMPLSLEPESTWEEDKEMYIGLIADWIARGAPDTYGNIPGEDNLEPQVVGMMAFNSGNTSNELPREGPGQSPILIPKGLPVDVWFAFSDDQTDVKDFKLTRLNSSYDLYDFSSAEDYSFNTSSTLQGVDFWNEPVTYTHKATIQFPNDTSGTFVYLRTMLRDDTQEDTTFIPNPGTSDIMRAKFTLKVDSL